jgi:hypothetical protein
MHDFLSRLSARTLGIAAAARPRTSTLFDPGSSDAVGPPAAVITSSNVNSVAGTWPNEAASPAAPARHTDTSKEPQRTAFDPPAPIVQVSPAASAFIPAPSAPPAPHRNGAKPNEVPVPAHPDGPAHSETQAHSEAQARHALPTLRLHRLQPARPLTDDRRTQPTPSMPRAANVVRHGSRTSEPTHSQYPVRADEPPAIRVTIGRVEVLQTAQATQATQPAQRPQPASRMVSLDDYLKRGSRG